MKQLPLLLLLLLPVRPAAGQEHPSEYGEHAGQFKITYYWVVFEEEFPGRPSVPLYDTNGKVLTVVTEKFSETVSMEGTGVLRDGRVVNLHEECERARHGWCFMMVDKEKAPFGYGSHSPLHPFRTLAVPDHVLPRGTVVYLPAYDGMPLPGDEGGFDFHDGCFVVEDTGWSLQGKHLDVFALSEDYYKTLIARVEEKQTVQVYTKSSMCPGTATALYNPEAWARELLSGQ